MNVHKAEILCRYDEDTHSKCKHISRTIRLPEMCKMTKRKLFEVNISSRRTTIQEVSQVTSRTSTLSEKPFEKLLQFYNIQNVL
jgi:hypothetical protein